MMLRVMNPKATGMPLSIIATNKPKNSVRSALQSISLAPCHQGQLLAQQMRVL